MRWIIGFVGNGEAYAIEILRYALNHGYWTNLVANVPNSSPNRASRQNSCIYTIDDPILKMKLSLIRGSYIFTKQYYFVLFVSKRGCNRQEVCYNDNNAKQRGRCYGRRHSLHTFHFDGQTTCLNPRCPQRDRPVQKYDFEFIPWPRYSNWLCHLGEIVYFF